MKPRVSADAWSVGDRADRGGQGVDLATSNNRTTIASYERIASDYARSTAPTRSADRRALQNFLDTLPGSGRVLEIGSGPGWDADWLEDHGVDLRRTDAATAFVEFQKARGACAELLDVVTDDLGHPMRA